MELLRDFRKISKSDISLAGGKGASLGEMTKAGISVPNGFVILSNAFEKFLEETDLNVEIHSILESVNHKEIHTIEHASEKIKALILEAEMPQDIVIEIQKFFKDLDSKYVAVRSSATAEDSASAAWAGQLESYLNTTEENLLENVKKCWASLFTPRAIFYRFEKDLHKQKISVAVVVQKMIESEKSGIAFSVHPVTQDRNQLISEAGFGLGEAIVSGQITPDSYVVEKQPRRIIDKNVQTQSRGLYRAENGGNEWQNFSKEQGEKQVLSDKEILELSEIILRIENHYSFPIDIEWAFENERFYIVQSRPITTLSKNSPQDKSDAPYFNKENSVFTFESKGTPFLFEDIVVSYYMNWSSLTLGNDGGVRVYVPKDEVDRLNKIGASLTNKDMAARAEGVKEAVRYMERELPNFQKKEKLAKEDVTHVFQRLAELCREYSYFDIHYSDGMWKSIEKGGEVKKNVALIEKYKNEIRDKLNMPFFTPDGWLVTMITKLGRQFDISVETLNWYREEEILSLFNGKLVSETTIAERKQCYAFYIDKNDRRILYAGTYAKQLDSEFLTEIDTKTTKIKGTVAHGSGRKVRGVVKIIRRDYSNPKVARDCMDAMKKGDILVSETTDPELMDGLKKAGAIITDVGGMLSHAAITARELDTPCIIGMEISSKILKNGDMVEVDTISSVVRILK